MLHQVTVSIVYASKHRQWVHETTVARGTSAQELLEMAGFLNEIPELRQVKADDLVLGVYAQKVPADYLLEEGDRVEIYRPLTADPKEVRRQLALLGKTMGKGGSKTA